MLGLNWRKRALEAEARLETALQMLDAMARKFQEANTLISINRDGRQNVFTFIRNNEIHRIRTIGTWDDDIDAWKKLLIDPLPRANDGE